jgi:hypothetical protein
MFADKWEHVGWESLHGRFFFFFFVVVVVAELTLDEERESN